MAKSSEAIVVRPNIAAPTQHTYTELQRAYEMAHLEDQHFGKPGKNGYHGKSWADMMDKVGLCPSDTAKPGGKRTGPKVSHYIVEGGAFDMACKALLEDGFQLPYMERTFTAEELTRAKKKTASKTKFCCPTCDAAAWGKPTLMVQCAECDELMLAEEK